MDFLSDAATIWFLVGLGLLLLEFIVPGIFILFFGIGAWITSLCVFLFTPSIGIQFLIFSASSLLTLFLLRKYILEWMNKPKEIDPDEEFIGNYAFCTTAISEGVKGRVEIKGTNYTAQSSVPITEGQKVKIVSKDGINLFVEPA